VAKTKLTLSVDQAIIERAKRFARRNRTSISKLVSDFLEALAAEEEESTPVVSRLRGVLPSTVSREEHRAHLESKHG